MIENADRGTVESEVSYQPNVGEYRRKYRDLSALTGVDSPWAAYIADPEASFLGLVQTRKHNFSSRDTWIQKITEERGRVSNILSQATVMKVNVGRDAEVLDPGMDVELTLKDGTVEHADLGHIARIVTVKESELLRLANTDPNYRQGALQFLATISGKIVTSGGRYPVDYAPED